MFQPRVRIQCTVCTQHAIVTVTVVFATTLLRKSKEDYSMVPAHTNFEGPTKKKYFQTNAPTRMRCIILRSLINVTLIIMIMAMLS